MAKKTYNGHPAPANFDQAEDLMETIESEWMAAPLTDKPAIRDAMQDLGAVWGL